MTLLSVIVVISVLQLFDGAEGLNWRCTSIGNIEHGYFTGNSVRTYTCQPGYVSNIPDLHKLKFRCGGDIKWKASKIKFASTKESLYLANITCQEKVRCSDPPSKQNLTVFQKQQYQLNLTSFSAGLAIGEPTYFNGDIINYTCAHGYEQKTNTPTDGYDYYYNYDNSDNMTVSDITCDNSGLWNGLPTEELSLIECTAVMCDATGFMNISNGNITNYKDTFEYLEAMQITCDEGYRAKGGVNSLLCLSSDSFAVAVFGCEQISCAQPNNPVNGRVYVDGLTVGDKAYFHCTSGTTMIGQSEWTCLPDGSWDSNCVICDDKESYCSPPCIPLGAEMISTETIFYPSSTVELTCSGGPYNAQTVTRTCMGNKAWSNTSIDCIGKSRIDPFVGKAILSALEKSFSNESKLANATEDGLVLARSIDVGNAFGVDVYFLIDVSNSIDEAKMKSRKQFMNALLPKLGINNGRSGTRLAFYFFASATDKGLNQHYVAQEQLFKNHTEARDYIDRLDLDKIRQTTKLGTAITTALEDVALDIKSKQSMKTLTRKAQQIVILISDGEYNTDGDPTDVATKLKLEPCFAEIYSIMIGTRDIKQDKAYRAMKEIASVIEDERHFFEIGNEEDLTNIINAMINDGKGANWKCGTTERERTKLDDGKKPIYEHDAQKHAWPWMAQLLTKGRHLCGGSLINKQWILTAAHCIEKTSKVILKKLKMADKEGVEEFHIQDSSKFKHPEYNENKDPKYLYDVALIKLPREVEISRELLPVCLPHQNESKQYFVDGIYGVVTGWGMSEAKGQFADGLKQMQMSIADCSSDDKSKFDSNKMFCAGGNDGGKIVDACQGDSGGPFTVRIKNDENTFVQIGVVSSGEKCKKDAKNGYYTKLSAEIIQWINKTISK